MICSFSEYLLRWFPKEGSLRISGLRWADTLVSYTLFLMQDYLTDVWDLSVTHAAGILNIFSGISRVLPCFFLFLVEAQLGNFTMLFLSSIACAAELGADPRSSILLTMSLIAVGRAGHRVSVKPFIDEQKDKENDGKAWTRDPLKLAGSCVVIIAPVFGVLVLPFIKPWAIKFRILARDPLKLAGFCLLVIVPVIGVFVPLNFFPWDIMFEIVAICNVVATATFLTGWGMYNKDPPQGSPITNVFRVFVAAVWKISQPLLINAKQLYTKGYEGFQSFTPTRFLGCLEKTAVIPPGEEPEDQVRNRWQVCTVSEVEDAKIVVRMVPMSLTFIVCGIVSSIGNTYFVEQASHLNPRIGKWKVPLLIFLFLLGLAKKYLFKLANWLMKVMKKYGPPIGITVAMVFSILCCIAAARIEMKRLGVIKRHGLLDNEEGEIPMSVFWLLFQFFFLAGLDSFLEKSVVAFYNNQLPESMRNYHEFFYRGVSGLGYMCSVVSVYVVGRVSERGGKSRNWFQPTLNRSRLDRYYWVLAGLSSVNLVVFILVASCYTYKEPKEMDEEETVSQNMDDGMAEIVEDGEMIEERVAIILDMGGVPELLDGEKAKEEVDQEATVMGMAGATELLAGNGEKAAEVLPDEGEKGWPCLSYFIILRKLGLLYDRLTRGA